MNRTKKQCPACTAEKPPSKWIYSYTPFKEYTCSRCFTVYYVTQENLKKMKENSGNRKIRYMSVDPIEE